MTTRHIAGIGAAITMAALLAGRPAWAGGFELWEGSTDQNANAYAGQAAKAYDAGTAWTNPAGMVRIGGFEADTSFNFIDPQFTFNGNNTDFPAPRADSASNQNVHAIFGAAVPASFIVMSLSPDLKFGLALKSPFGARIHYPDNWVGRYQSLDSSLTDIAIEPSLAYAVTPKFSIGGGPVIDWLNLRESQAVKPVVGGQYGDIVADAYGSNWALGYNIATLYQFDDGTRVGLSYRSRIEHHTDIKQTLSLLPNLADSPDGALVQAVTNLQNTPGHPYAVGLEKFNLPDSVDASLFHQLTPEWTLLAEAIWTHWQIFNNITVQTFGNGNLPVVNQFSFHNTMFGSLGASYRPHFMPRLLLQFGAGYDQDPVTDGNRQAQIPTEDRVLVGGGFTYTVNDHVSVDVGYNHYFCLPASIDNTGPSLANALQSSAGRLIGNYDNSIDSFSGGVKVRF